jgi:hypothetical protein
MVKWAVISKVLISLIVICLVNLMGCKPRKGGVLKNEVVGPFGDPIPHQPIYRAVVATDSRVKMGDYLNIAVQFNAKGALEYRNGPDYVVTIQKRVDYPIQVDGNYLPGYYDKYGIFRLEGIKSASIGGRRVWQASSPSRKYNEIDPRFVPFAWGKFKAKALIPGHAQVTARLKKGHIDLPAEVYPFIVPVMTIKFIRTEPERDINGNLIAMRISFYVDGYPQGWVGFVEVLSITGRLVKTIAANIQLGSGPGLFTVHWDLTDENGNLVPEGTYLVKITAKEYGSNLIVSATHSINLRR